MILSITFILCFSTLISAHENFDKQYELQKHPKDLEEGEISDFNETVDYYSDESGKRRM